MNKKGVYTPVQISQLVDKYWDKLDQQSDATNQNKQKLSVNKNECREITESVVNDLGKIGNGIKFDEDLYKECLTQVDYWGTKKITKQYITNLVTKMVTSKIE